MNYHNLRVCIIMLLHVGMSAAISGCSSSGQLVIDLMSPPGIYSETDIDPFADYSKISEAPVLDVLYATNRSPVEENSKERFYENERGRYVRLGRATTLHILKSTR